MTVDNRHYIGQGLATYCSECQHPLDAHHQVDDHTDCTSIYVDPLTGEETFCTCSRGCCLPERCQLDDAWLPPEARPDGGMW